MIALSRQRPASITAFAVLFFGAALVSFLSGLLNISGQQIFLQRLVPAVTWSHDAVIVWQSAWLSIALIPIAMVWLSAIRFARWMVTIMAAPKVLGLVVVVAKGLASVAALPPQVVASALLTLLAAAMLFTPASNRWFARQDEPDPAIFE